MAQIDNPAHLVPQPPPDDDDDKLQYWPDTLTLLALGRAHPGGAPGDLCAAGLFASEDSFLDPFIKTPVHRVGRQCSRQYAVNHNGQHHRFEVFMVSPQVETTWAGLFDVPNQTGHGAQHLQLYFAWLTIAEFDAVKATSPAAHNPPAFDPNRHDVIAIDHVDFFQSGARVGAIGRIHAAGPMAEVRASLIGVGTGAGAGVGPHCWAASIPCIQTSANVWEFQGTPPTGMPPQLGGQDVASEMPSPRTFVAAWGLYQTPQGTQHAAVAPPMFDGTHCELPDMATQGVDFMGGGGHGGGGGGHVHQDDPTQGAQVQLRTQLTQKR